MSTFTDNYGDTLSIHMTGHTIDVDVKEGNRSGTTVVFSVDQARAVAKALKKAAKKAEKYAEKLAS